MTDLSILEKRIRALEFRLNAFGIPTEQWLSPEEAAKILGCKRDKIRSEILRAEEARRRGEKHDVVFGVHYTNMAAPKSGKSLWRVDPIKLREVMILTPPENRPTYEWEQK